MEKGERSEAEQELDSGLQDAALQGDAEEIRKLLAMGADPNARRNGWSALSLAALSRSAAAAGALLDAGAYQERMDGDPASWTMLMEMSFLGDIESMRKLARAGADLDAVSEEGETALLVAARHEKEEAVRELLALGADPNAKSERKLPLLHFAAINGNARLARMLLEAGADWRAKNGAGETAEEQARSLGKAEMADLLARIRIAQEERRSLDAVRRAPRVGKRGI